MVKLQELSEKDKEALKNANRYKIVGPGARPSIDPKKIAKITERVKVDKQKPPGIGRAVLQSDSPLLE